MIGEFFIALLGGAYFSARSIKSGYDKGNAIADKKRRGVDNERYFELGIMNDVKFIELYETSTEKKYPANTPRPIHRRELCIIEIMELEGKTSDFFPYSIYKKAYDEMKRISTP